MKLIKVEQTPKSDDKKLIATFCKCKDGKAMCKDKDKVKIKFGSKTSTTYAEGATDETMQNYIKRHKVNEDWTKINPGSLSRWVLWSAKSISEGIKNFRNKFKC